MTDRIQEDNITLQAQPERTLDPASLQVSPYGCDVQPRGPLQDMFGSFDLIAGTFPPSDRMTPQGQFTGGVGPADGVSPLGGVALPPSPDKVGVTVPSNPAPNPTEPL